MTDLPLSGSRADVMILDGDEGGDSDGMTFEQEEGLGLRVGTPFRDNSARSVQPERPANSRGSERPRASRGTERPKASRGGERRVSSDAEHMSLNEPRERAVLEDRPSDSRSGARPKASKSSVRRVASDGDRIIFDDSLDRVALDDRPQDSRSGERPKASRSSSRRTHPQIDTERVTIEPDTSERLVDSSGCDRPDRPKASRGSDRLKSRGGDRGRRVSSEEHDQMAERQEQRAADRSERYETREQEVMINEDKPITLQDWFSNPANQLPSEYGPPPNSRTLLSSADENLLYEEVDGLGMRVSSALGTTRGEAERLRVDTEESDLARHKTQDRKDFTRVPSDRHVRLAEMLASEAGQVEELKSGESCILPRPAEPLELFQPPDAAEAAQEQAASSRKHGDKAAREYQPAVKGAESMKVETNAKAERSRDARVANNGPKKPGVGVASSRPNVPAVSGSTTKRSVGASPSKASGAPGIGNRTVPGAVHASGSSNLSTSHRDRAPQRTRERPRCAEARPMPSRPVTKEASQERLKIESSRTSTARSHMSSRVTQTKNRLSSAASESTPRNNAPTATIKGEVSSERSKHDMGDKTARPGTSAEQQMNMKILEHALGVNPKLKKSPLARTARFGVASKAKARASSPGPQERATTAVSIANSAINRDVDMPDVMKKRPPWNPSTLDTLYSPRKPDTSPPKSRDTSPNKGARDATPGREAPQQSAVTSSKSARTVERSTAANGMPPAQTRSPPRLRTAEMSVSSNRGLSSQTDSKGDKIQTPRQLDSQSSLRGAEAPQAPVEENAGALSDVKTGINEESMSSSTGSFAPGVSDRHMGGTRDDNPGFNTHEGYRGTASTGTEPIGNEFLIPPEYQNLDRPLTRRDERPSTRREDMPTTRGGLEERPGTRSGLEDRPTTRGLDGRLRSRHGLVAADGRPIINEDKHLREALADEGEFDPRPAQEIDAEHEDYYARIRAEVGYDDDAFESDAESSDPDAKYQTVITSPDGRAEIMTLDGDSASEHEAEGDQYLMIESQDEDDA